MIEEQEKYEVTGKEETGMGLVTKQAQVSMFLNEQRFEFAQRIGKMLSASTMVPEHFRNNIGNCLIALNLSERLGIDVFGLMQTSYVVHGRPGFEAKLLIALFNSRTELFIPPLRWEMKGEFPKGKDSRCRAYAIDKDTKEPLYGEWIDWEMIEAEGWNVDKPYKSGQGVQKSKWNTIPGQMFRYRAASFFINAYEPGLKMGIQTVDELEDMIIDVTPRREIKVDGEAPEKPTYEVKDFEELKGVTDKENPPPSPPPPEIKIDGKTLDEKTLFRNEWVNLKGAGYSTYIFKNATKIEANSKKWPDLFEEMQEKWVKLYPGVEWPLIEKGPEKPQESPESPPDDTIKESEGTHPDIEQDELNPVNNPIDFRVRCKFFQNELGTDYFAEILKKRCGISDNTEAKSPEDRERVLRILSKELDEINEMAGRNT